MKKLMIILLATFASPALCAAPGDWPTYGHDWGGMRYSPLAQITPANVSTLQVAWTYHMRPVVESGGTPVRVIGSETTPLVVKGILYLGSPYGRIIALDDTTGKVIWSYIIPNNDRPSTRGIEYWPGSGKAAPEILFGTNSGKLMALNAQAGTPVETFGDKGVVNLRTPEVMKGFDRAALALTSPPIVYKNLVITGSMVQESPTLGPSGDVRAWDARTGKLVWTFYSIPQPGESGHYTWVGDSWQKRSGVNVWGLMTVDAKRGIAYLPFGAPTVDRYGGDREGTNLYSSALVAVDAASGKYLWHFQLVHHDIWDYDLDTPPMLLDVRRNGKTIPAVAAMNKSAFLFLLNRVTGKPIYEVTETSVPKSDVTGEEAWPTQPIPSKPAQLARGGFTQADVATVTPALNAYCENVIAMKKVHDSVPFSPLTMDSPIARFPGSGGGPEWGGGAFDPKHGYYIVNTNDMGSIEQLAQRPDGSWGTTTGADSFFMDPNTKMMCQQPPWGSLYAVNVNTGEIAWRTTLGVTDSLPEGQQNTGRPSVGGPIVTAGGLIFIGGTDDSRFRAFDVVTGKELWTYKLDYSAHATPITYRGENGKQYVAVVATGGTFLRSPAGGDSLVVFALQ
jgi:quinoprotein glucose dehydrogenase